MPEGSSGSNPEVNQPVRLPKRESHAARTASIGAGQAFWDKLAPEMQAVIEEPIRRTEEIIAQQFPDGYSSPLIAKARAIRDEDHLERQHDLTSCTLVATANAFRLVDQPRVEYSRDTLKARAEELSGRNQPTVGPENLRQIFSSAPPFTQFSLRVLPDVKVRFPNTSPEMMSLFHSLQEGDIAIASWRKDPTRVVGVQGEGFISHARTIVGFTKGENNTILIHVVDPYGARQETWSFRDWIVGMRMNALFDNPLSTAENMKLWMRNMDKASGLMAGIAKDVWVIHKRRPQIVVQGRK